MHDASFMQSLRLRTSQCLTWFMGATQTQQQYTQSDRLQRDGTIRSQQDPDTQLRHGWGQETGLTLRERFQAWGGSQGPQADTQARQQQYVEQQHREQQQRGGWPYGR
jgi:hypothetical protein